MTERYIKLDFKDFHCLICGGELQINDERKNETIKIILEDIGFDNMINMISLIQDDFAQGFKDMMYKNHTKVIKKPLSIDDFPELKSD